MVNPPECVKTPPADTWPSGNLWATPSSSGQHFPFSWEFLLPQIYASDLPILTGPHRLKERQKPEFPSSETRIQNTHFSHVAAAVKYQTLQPRAAWFSPRDQNWSSHVVLGLMDWGWGGGRQGVEASAEFNMVPFPSWLIFPVNINTKPM